MTKKRWICCGKEFPTLKTLIEHLESVHGMNRPNRAEREEIDGAQTQTINRPT